MRPGMLIALAIFALTIVSFPLIASIALIVGLFPKGNPE